MIPKQLNERSQNASPSGFLINQQPSEISFNPSFIKQPSQRTQSGLKKSSHLKKHLKFDAIQQNDMAEVLGMVDETKSQQNIQIEFHFSNCLNKMNQLLKSKYFQILYIIILVVFMVNCIIQAALISNHVEEITQNIDFGLQIFFTVTILIKFTQFQNLQTFWITIDILTNISGYLSLGIKEHEQPVRYLRALKTLRLLLLVKEINYLKLPASKLINSLSSVGKILFPAVLFIYFYAVIGLYSFRDYEYSKCRDPSNKFLTENWTVYEDQIFLCGQKSCPLVNGIQYQCLNPIDYGVQPDSHQVKNIMQGNGLMRYNNIFYSLFSTFKQTFITGSSRLMILGKQVTDYFYVLIYYLSFIYLLAYIYLNIFYGLLITNQQESQDVRKDSIFQLRLNRVSQRKITYQSQNFKDSMQKKQMEGLQIQPTFKKTNSNNQIDNLQSCNEMNRQQNMDLQKVQDLENIPSNRISQNKSSFLQFNGQKKFIQSHQPTGFQSFDEKTSQENLFKYKEIMKKYYFINHVIVILCSANILIDWQGQTYNEKLIVDTIDFAFFWIYMLQMIFRFIIHKIYVPNQPMDRAGKLDFFIFFLCTCGQSYEVATAQNVHHFLMASDEISRLLRTIKYLRIFILISSTPYFKEARIIFNSTLEAVYSVRYLSVLWLLILVIFSIMGFHMFEGKVKIDHQGHLDLQHGHPQHIAFEGIVDSFIFTVFIFFNQQWDWLLFQQYVSQQFWIVIWVLIVLVIGLQVLSKYFMALLMKELGDRLNQQEELNQQKQEGIIKAQNQLQQIFMNTSSNRNQILPAQSSHTFKLKKKQLSQNQQQNFVKNTSHQKHTKISINPVTGLLDVKNKMNEQNKSKQKEKKLSIMRDMILQQPKSQSHSVNSSKKSRVSNKISNKFYQNNKGNVQQQSMSWLEKKKMKLTIFLKSKFFKVIKVMFIILSIICTLAMSPLNDPNSEIVQIYTKIWYVTIVFFGLEILVSIFAFGPFNQKGGYFGSIMNWIYVLVFVIEIISVIPGLKENGHLQSILSFRIFRVFVFIELKYESDADMRLTMVSFWKLLPKILNLLAITVIMYGFFAILLVKLYKDDYYYCDGYEENATIQTQQDCMNWGGSWVQRKMNVSNILKSLLYLFLLATTEGWSTQVIESASLAGQGHQPEYGKNIWIQYFFSVFFYLGNLIMLNVFIGLSVYNFQKIKSQVTGLSRLSKNDKMWFSIKNTIHRLSPKMKDTPPNNSLSQYVYQFKNSKIYKIINVILFILFMVSMSLYTTNMSNQNQKILDTILTIFVGIFMFEYLVSWLALGLRIIKHKKFIFETVGIIYFIVVFGLTYATNLEPKLDRILHGIVICFLAIRYFALLNDVQFIRKMVNSLLSVFPQTYNIWLLIFLTLFTYAVIGIYFFGYLKISPQLNEFDQNYTDLKSSIYALIKFSTLQSPILQIIDSTSTIEPNSVCFDIYSYDDFIKYGRMGCGNRVVGYIFFLSFLIIYSMILLSTLLAVIVDAYSEVRRQQESMVNKFQLQEVQKQWENYDPQATGYIGYRDFWMFTAKLVKIYKVNKEELLSHETKQSFLKSLQIPIYEDENGVLSFQFHQVVQALTRIVLKQKMGSSWDTKQADKVFKNHHQHGLQGKLFKKSAYDSSHVLTLIVMKSGLKAWKRKAVNTQNQQNLQNLFAITKKDKNIPQINIDKNSNHVERGKQKQQNQPQQNDINVSKNLKNSLSSPSNNQKIRMKKPIQRIDFQSIQKQLEQQQQVQYKNLQLFENSHSKSPRMNIEKPQKKQARKILTASEVNSKIKSPKDNLKLIQSDRQKQNLNFINKDDKSNQDDGMSQLQQIK